MLEPRPQDKIAGEIEVNDNWSLWFNLLTDRINYGEPPSDTISLGASDQIRVNSSLMRIQASSAGTIQLTSNPQVTAGFDGQRITIEGMNDTNIIRIIDGNGLQLAGSASFDLGLGDTITLHYNKSRNIWIENYRSNN